MIKCELKEGNTTLISGQVLNTKVGLPKELSLKTSKKSKK